jgi:putative nucleotidyltransferase-like protein
MNASQKQLSNEFVLSLLGASQTEEALSRLGTLSVDEWAGVIEAAEVQGAAPMLLGRVQALKLGVPAETGRQLREILHNNTARNLQMLRQFETLAAALVGAGIPFMPLKGIYLCTNLYASVGDRPVWDIDLLVPPTDIERAAQAVEGLGYRPSRPYRLDLEQRSYHHLPVFRKKGAAPLELHWTLLNPRFKLDLDWDELWGRSVTARVGEAHVQVLSPADLVIYLCAHTAYQHVYMDSVRSLYDIKLAVERFASRLDWGEVAQRSTRWHLLNSLYLTLRLTDQLLGCSIPQSVWPRLRPADFHEELVAAAAARLMEDSEASPVVSAIWARDNLFQRIQGLWGRIAVPRSVLAGRYKLPPDSWRVSFYYFVRAWDMLRQRGGSLLGLLLGDREHRARAARDSRLVSYLKWW